MSQDTNLSSLVINKLTQKQYDENVHDSSELYVTKDTNSAYLGDLQIGNTISDERLHALKGYSDKGELLEDAEGLADVVEYAHSSFDRSKFTVVGTPTITDDGIVSNISDSDYVTMSSDFLTASTWKMIVPLPKGSTGWGGIISRLGTNSLQINLNDKTVAYSISSNGTSWDIGGSSFVFTNLDTTKDALFVLEFTGTEYKMYAIQNGTILTGTTITSSSNIYNNSSALVFGQNRSLNAPTNGTIDLKQVLVYANDIPVFSGNKTGIDTIKPDDYTVVGTPTISADGVVMHSDTNNYVSGIPPEMWVGKSWRFDIDINFDPYSSQNYIRFCGDRYNFIAYNYNWNSIYSPMYTTDGENHQISIESIRSKFQKGKIHIEYYFDYTTGERYFTATQNGTTYKSSVQTYTNKDFKNQTANFMFANGYNYNSEFPIYTPIDLNSVKFYIDGNLVYQPCLKIPYTKSKTGSKVVDSYYRSRVNDMAEQFGYANYYTLNENKANNYMAVGSPTISADGIASGFSSANYLQTTSITLGSGDFDIYTPVKFTSALSNYTNGRILAQDDKIRIMPYNSTLAVAIVATDNSYIINSNFVPTINTEYLIHLYKTGTTYGAEYSSNNGLNWTNISQVTSDKQVYYYNTAKEFKLGNNIAGGDIELNLNSFKIYVDGKLAYKAIQPPCFTLPQAEVYGLIGQRTLRDSYRNGIFYYELYSDRTLEQGGSCESGVEYTFSKPFTDANYVLTIPYSSKTATSFIPSATGDFIAKGQGAL